MTSRGDTTLQPAQILINGKTLDTPRAGAAGRSAPTPRDRSTLTSPRSTRSPMSSPEASAVDQVMNINRRLVTQIETLRLKVEIDARHQEAAKANVQADAEAKVKVKDSQLKELKADLKGKDEVVKNLKDKNHMKESAIHKLEENIKELKEDVFVSKGYANEIQSQLELLQSATASLESGTAYSEKDDHIRQLQTEVENLHKNLAQLERELSKAKEKISQQGTQLRLVDMDRLNVQAKYKEELAKVTQTMRGDIERMRDVMRQQWEEMRDLREQNEDMRSDIREIRNLIMAERQQQEDQRLAHASPGSSNQTRMYGHVHSPYELSPLNPTLPALSPKERTRMYSTGRKKT